MKRNLWVVFVLLTCPSCIFPSRTQARYYACDLPHRKTAQVRHPKDLAVRPFQAPPHLEERMLHRRSEAERLYAESARWLDQPDRMVQHALALGLAQAGLFRTVRTDISYGEADWVLEGAIAVFEIEGEPDSSTQAALLEIQLELFDGRTRASLWRMAWSARKPVEGGDAEAAARAMRDALTRVLAEAVSELEQLRPTAAAPPPVGTTRLPAGPSPAARERKAP